MDIYIILTEKEVVLLQVVWQLAPVSLSPYLRDPLPQQQHIGDGDVGVLQKLVQEADSRLAHTLAISDSPRWVWRDAGSADNSTKSLKQPKKLYQVNFAR